MKNKFLIKSALLASALLLSMSSAMAMPVVPYTASTNANGDIDSTNIFGNTAESSVGTDYTFSQSRATNYTLGSESRINTQIVNDSLDMESYPSLYTQASSFFSQTFKVTAAGTAILRFDWDGTIYSDGTFGAGYSFNAFAAGENGYLGGVSNGTSSYGGSIAVNLFGFIELIFSENDIGNIFDVSATLSTWAGANEKADMPAEYEYPEIPYGYAYANFLNTATFNVLGTPGIIAPAAVPVPAAVWLFGSALMGLVGIRRKKAIS